MLFAIFCFIYIFPVYRVKSIVEYSWWCYINIRWTTSRLSFSVCCALLTASVAAVCHLKGYYSIVVYVPRAVPFICDWLIDSFQTFYPWLVDWFLSELEVCISSSLHWLWPSQILFTLQTSVCPCIYTSDFAFHLFVHSLALCVRFHTEVRPCDVCLSQSHSFHVTSYPLGPSVLLQMAWAHPFCMAVGHLCECACVCAEHVFLSIQRTLGWPLFLCYCK